ncbi:DUF1667 domain-containing protein [Caldicellulosiruptor changbaiensis]|uniref:DUF1667 domain-containing protein n=1 Tax=Caldicellulosiruptor changbaiensis TaxID=1222016 RepID=A0A3T0D911_9FIRM|nr:DUF1667 domain-containing protein [Caldicellulosiruptor changbaiensis]AZT91671.1 DUF1667 domain-containing protein [Caldicellulosiruptor changbaiensis]
MDKITCILCPKGCSIEKKEEGNEIKYIGYGCSRGLEYAKDEFTQPKRILTTTIHVKDGEIEFLPVRTDKPIPKRLLFDAMAILRKIEVTAPVKVGFVVVKNILDTGADVIATRKVNRKSSF